MSSKRVAEIGVDSFDEPTGRSAPQRQAVRRLPAKRTKRRTNAAAGGIHQRRNRRT